ncbi:MAG: signal peptidase II [Candidatus Firestonebacteria bacterium]|nr:signal peptidase II [Candidatus Firestonebacteria bacterium]
MSLNSESKLEPVGSAAGVGAVSSAAVKRPSSRAYFWGFGLVVLALDWFTKWLVVRNFQPYQSLSIWGEYVQLTYVRNAGGAFSLLANSPALWRSLLFIGIAAVTMVVLAVLAYREKQAGWDFLIPLGLICGGAAGNLIDRVTVGTVVDFIEVGVKAYHWPVFNLADSAIDIGVVWLLAVNLFTGHKASPAA